MSDVAKSFKMEGYNLNDDPIDLLKYSERHSLKNHVY